MSYDNYVFDIKTIKHTIPDYLRTEGNRIMNFTELLYDIRKIFSDDWFGLWDMFNLNNLESEWLSSLSNNKTFPSVYTDFINYLGSTYGISRNHEIFKDGPIGGQNSLNNLQMIRLIKFKTFGINFDGTKKSLVDLLNNTFPRDFGLQFVLLNSKTNYGSAEANLLVSQFSDDYFNEVDSALFNGGYYFVQLLGINVKFNVVTTDSLFYDIGSYDDSKKYDGGDTQ